MLRKEQKTKLIEEIGSAIKESKSVIFVDLKGVKTKPIEHLRHELRGSGSVLRVVRKTFLGRAISANNIVEAFDAKKLEGQVAIIFGDVLAAAKACAVFAKKEKAFKFVGGILDGKLLSSKEASALATIPSRQELLGQLAILLSGPIRGLAVSLNAIPRSLAIALSEVSKKK